MVRTTTGNLINNQTGSSPDGQAWENNGTYTANGVTAVVITDTGYTKGDIVLFGNTDFGGTPNGPYLSAGTTGTGFSVKSAASDTGVYNWVRFTPATQQTS